jgi:hypothetical protein
MLGADVVSGSFALHGCFRSPDARFFPGGADAKVGPGSLDGVLGSRSSKFIGWAVEVLSDCGATVPHLRCLSGSLTLNELDIRSLVGELRALGSESGSGVLGSKTRSLHAESASSCLVFQTGLIEAKLATGAIDAEIGAGSLDPKVNTGPLVLVRSVVLAEASGGPAANSCLEASNATSSTSTE